MILARILYLHGDDGRDALGEYAFAALPAAGDRIHIERNGDVETFKVARIDHYPAAKGSSAIVSGPPAITVIVHPWKDR